MATLTIRLCTVVPLSGLFLFYFFRRFGQLFFPFWKGRLMNLCAAAAAILLAFCRWNKWGLGEFLVGHFVTFALVIEVIHWIILYGIKKKYPTWIKLVEAGIFPVLLLIATLIYGYLNMTTIQDTSYTVVTQKEIREEGYNIILLSDLHFNTTMDIEKFQKICDEISAEQADMVVMCGDIIDDNTTKQEMQEVFAAAGTIQSTYGVFYVYGNHDRQPYYPQKKFTAAELAAAIEEAGIHGLSDETVEINDEFVIVGREDAGGSLTSHRADIQTLLQGVDTQKKFVMVLDHKPIDVENCGDSGCDLQLSGHTHGGQVWPNSLINGWMRDYYYGCESYKNYTVIITSGIGGWGFPLRTGSRSEIVKIHITK